MMDEYIEDKAKLEEEIVIKTPPHPYIQPGYPFLTLPSPSKTSSSNFFDEIFPFFNSDSFLDRTSTNGNSRRTRTNRNDSSSSSTTTSSSSSSTSSSSRTSTSFSSSSTKQDKNNPNINLFSLFIKHYGNLDMEYNFDTSSSSDKSTTTRQTNSSSMNRNRNEFDDSNNIVNKTSHEPTTNNVSNEDSEDKSSTEDEEDKQQPLHESVFKTIMRRLATLERNTTLSFKYLEEQGKIFNQYIIYLHKKQQTSLQQLIKDNNMIKMNLIVIGKKCGMNFKLINKFIMIQLNK
jgi:hypothetical protein